MKSFEKILSERPLRHHAYGIQSATSILDQISRYFNSDDFSYIFAKKYDSFQIDDARTIIQLQSQRTDKPTLFILEFSMINVQSQNALLKIIEEPTSQTFFIFVFPERKKLLDTLQSRLEIIRQEGELLLESRINAKLFISKNLFQRFEYIKSLVDDKSTDGLSKSELIHFLNELEVELTKGRVEHIVLGDIFAAREYLESNGASIKMILEQIAISLNISETKKTKA